MIITTGNTPKSAQVKLDNSGKRTYHAAMEHHGRVDSVIASMATNNYLQKYHISNKSDKLQLNDLIKDPIGH